MSDDTLSGKRLAQLQAEESAKQERAAARKRGRTLPPEELASQQAIAKSLSGNPKRVMRYLRESSVEALVMLRGEMQNNPDSRARMDASKQLLAWGSVATRLLKKQARGREEE